MKKKAYEIMKKEVIVINQNAQIQEACDLLIKNNLSGMPVVDKQGKLVGFLSERDIIKSIASGNFQGKNVSGIMNKQVCFVKEDEPLTNVTKVFFETDHRNLPVTKQNGRIVGIISRKEVVNKLMKHYF